MSHDRASPHPSTPGPDQERRRYSSFTVRVWCTPGAATYDRAEVHHIQSDQVTTGTRVDIEWIRATVAGFITGDCAQPPEPE